MLQALNGERVYWVLGTLLATGAPVISIDISTLLNSFIGLLLMIVGFFLRGWYVATQQHFQESERRFGRIERALSRLGERVTPGFEADELFNNNTPRSGHRRRD